MSEVPQDLDFAYQALAVHRVLKRFWYLLDGDSVVCLHIAARAYETVRALPDSLANSVRAGSFEAHAADVVPLVVILGDLVLLLLHLLVGGRRRRCITAGAMIEASGGRQGADGGQPKIGVSHCDILEANGGER